MSVTEVTPIVLEVIEGALESARREIELQVQRTARSQIIREITDLRAGVYSSTGQSVTSLSYAPTPSPIMRKFAGRINDGDIFLHNNVYSADGGISHLPDLCITVPVFESDELVAFIMTFGHTEDIGGMEVSSMPMLATDIHQEGLIVPPVKLYDRGVRNEALWDVIGDNSRFPITLLSDLDAFINASKLGARRVTEIVARYGLDVVNYVFEALLARCSHDILHEAMPKIPDGTYDFEDYIEYDGVQPLETRRFLKLRMKMIKSPEKVVFDFTGTSDQSPGNVNWPGDEKYYAKYFGTLLKAFAPDLIVNDGIQDVVSCVMPDGCFLRPKYPAAVAHRSNALVRMLDVGMGVLAQATNGQVPGAAETLSYYILYGHDDKGRLFLFRDVTGAGSGARFFADGDDTVYLSPNSKNMPGEVAEQLFPLRFERIGLRSDSGGPGKFRGGLGYVRDVRILVDCNLLVISDRGQLNPWGVSGGKAGAKGVHILNPGTPEEIVLPAMLPAMPVKAGSLLHWMTPGGGGWGDALERDVDLVRLDVLRGLVSRQSAADHYGVIFDDGDELTVNAQRTAEFRGELARSRPPLPMFDRGERYYELVEEGEIVPTMEDGLAIAP